MNRLKVCDQWCLDCITTIYEYLWDYWNIHIGTFRFVITIPVLVLVIIETKSNFDVVSALLTAWALVWPFYFHLWQDNKLQQSKQFALLNARASVYRLIWIRLYQTASISLLCALSHNWHSVIISCVILIIVITWSYACGVYVRDRREKKHQFSFRSQTVMQGT